MGNALREVVMAVRCDAEPRERKYQVCQREAAVRRDLHQVICKYRDVGRPHVHRWLVRYDQPKDIKTSIEQVHRGVEQRRSRRHGSAAGGR